MLEIMLKKNSEKIFQIVVRTYNRSFLLMIFYTNSTKFLEFYQN